MSRFSAEVSWERNGRAVPRWPVQSRSPMEFRRGPGRAGIVVAPYRAVTTFCGSERRSGRSLRGCSLELPHAVLSVARS